MIAAWAGLSWGACYDGRTWLAASCSRSANVAAAATAAVAFRSRLAAALQRPGRLVRRAHRRSLLLPDSRLADPVRRSAGARLRGPRRAALLLRRRRGAGIVRARHAERDRVLVSGAGAQRGDDVFWLCGRASGSIVLGLVGALFFVLPRAALLQLPEVPVLRGGHPAAVALCRRARRSRRGSGSRSSRWSAFLFRHDHGVFIAASMAALLVLMRDLSWGRAAQARRRLRRAGGRDARAVPPLHPAQRRRRDLLSAGVGVGRARPRPRAGGLARAVRQPRRRVRRGASGVRRDQGGGRACATTWWRGPSTPRSPCRSSRSSCCGPRATAGVRGGRRRAPSWAWWRSWRSCSSPSSCAVRWRRAWPIRRCRWRSW